MATEEKSSSLEHELESMLEIERFDPPAAFREKALWSDPGIYEEAAADPEASTPPTRPSTSGLRTAA
jgi:hypothetical protein